MPPEPRPRLDSWKEIARYLGRDIRTVTRWERERRLPVHRIPGGGKGGAWAYPDELDAWLRGDGLAIAAAGPRPASPRRRLVVVGAIVAGCAALTVALIVSFRYVSSRQQAIEQVVVEGPELRALAPGGRILWSYSPAGVARLEAGSGRWSEIVDLDGDGRAEVLAVLRDRTPPPDRGGTDTLYCFTSDGRVRWTQTFSEPLRFAAGEFEPPWFSSHLSYEGAGPPRILWAVRHHTWWPSILFALDSGGHITDRFVSAGWIWSVAVSDDGAFVLVAGITNARMAHFLAVLDPHHVSGATPEPPGSGFECGGCPAGRPLKYFVFPRTDVSRASQFYAVGPGIATYPGGSVVLGVVQNDDPSPPSVVFEFGPDLELRRAAYDDRYWEWHRRLEREGRLDHAQQACPDRDGPAIDRWAPDSGWTRVGRPTPLGASF